MSDLNVPTFQDELEALINKHCLERHSNTPDFVLAEFMAMSLAIFNNAVNMRSRFYAPVSGAVEHRVEPTVESGGKIVGRKDFQIGEPC